MTRLALNRLVYQYEDSTAPIFDGVSFTTEGDRILAVLGRSGCGKTTLLNLLLGYLRPMDGQVLVDDEAVSGPSPSRIPVFQEDGLWPWLTTLENVTLPYLLRGGRNSAKERGQDAALALTSCGLEPESFAQLPRQLSLGMRRRVQFARVLLLSPQMILADEPFTGVDILTRVALQKLLVQVWTSTHSTVLVATHDVDEAIFLAHTILLVDQSGSLMSWDNPFQGDEPSSGENGATSQLKCELLGALGRKDA